MRRILFRIVLLLVIGAVINVAIAWGLAIRAPNFREPLVHYWALGHTHTYNYDQYPGEISVSVGPLPRHDYVDTALTRAEFESHLPAWSMLRNRDALQEIGAADFYDELATGWPMTALRYQWWLMGDSSEHGPAIGMLRLPEHWVRDPNAAMMDLGQKRAELPLIPIWSGFCVNTLLYACATWLVFFAPFATLRYSKRARRRRKGLCLRCGYDLRGASGCVCPECGSASASPV